MKRKILAFALPFAFIMGISTFSANANPDPTGTYSDDGCGTRKCDGQACNCTTVIVITKEEQCLA